MTDKLVGGGMFSASQARGQRNISTVDIALDVALADYVIRIPGTLIYLDRVSTGYCFVEINQEQGGALDAVTMLAGDSIECPFQTLKISAPAQLGKVLRLKICIGVSVRGGSGMSTGATALVINTVDGGLARTLAGQAHLGVANVAPVAAQYAHAQLYNPVGSGRSLMLEAVSFSSATSGQSIGLGGYSAAYGGAATPWSKLVGGAAGVGQVRYTNNAGTLLTGTSLLYQVASSVIVPVNFREPVVIPPGCAFCIVGLTVNANLQGNFEWYEQ